VKVLLSGYFGFGNTGDEIIHAVLKNELNKKGFEVFSLVKEPHGINEFARNNFQRVRKAVQSVDLLISGGGGLLQDTTSSRSLYYYLALIYYAKKLGKKAVVLAQGIGPIKKAQNIFITKKVLNLADLITVRDRYSFSIISEDTNKSKVHITADLAFLFDDEKEVELPFKDYAIFAPALSKHMPNTETLIEIANIIKNKTSLSVVLFPMFPSFDGGIAKSISDATKIPIFESNDLSEKAFFVKNAKFLVGTRYHSIILSASKGVPFISLAYDPKVSSLAEEFGEQALPYGNLSVSEFESSLHNLLQNNINKKSSIQSRSKELNNRAKENFELLYDFLSIK
jgi:polysaccharide pyruvyl transferase CsaB